MKEHFHKKGIKGSMVPLRKKMSCDSGVKLD